MRPLSKRAVTYARRWPGQTATQIAHALRARPSTISSALHKAVAAGELVRTTAEWGGKGNYWNVMGGGGPGGGHRYGPTARVWR